MGQRNLALLESKVNTRSCRFDLAVAEDLHLGMLGTDALGHIVCVQSLAQVFASALCQGRL